MCCGGGTQTRYLHANAVNEDASRSCSSSRKKRGKRCCGRRFKTVSLTGDVDSDALLKQRDTDAVQAYKCCTR